VPAENVLLTQLSHLGFCGSCVSAFVHHSNAAYSLWQHGLTSMRIDGLNSVEPRQLGHSSSISSVCFFVDI